MNEKSKDDHDAGAEGEEQELDIHSAAVLDKNGKEIPITPEMIDRACEELDKNADKADENP